MSLRIILCTIDSPENGAQLARTLVQERLAACVNIVPGIRSVYAWEGRVHEETEQLLLIKTSGEKIDQLKQRVLDLHPYDTPELVALSPTHVLESYLSWVEEATADLPKS